MSERLRWGVLGGNSWIARDAIVPAIRKSRNGHVAALGSRNPAAVKGADGAKIVSYDAVLADPDIDAIYIPLPNSLHFEWALRAAEAGKPTLCEKPLALNHEETARMVDAFERRGVLLMEGFMYRFHPQHRRVLALVDSGAIGDVLEVRTHLSVDLTTPPDPD